MVDPVVIPQPVDWEALEREVLEARRRELDRMEEDLDREREARQIAIRREDAAARR